MRAWVVEIGEPIPGLDGDTREWRCGMLTRALAEAGHEVTWWASTFDHASRRHRSRDRREVPLRGGVTARLLDGPGYRRSGSLRRFFHQRAIARAFQRTAPSRDKPHVLFCCLPTLELAEVSVLYGRRAGVPVLVDIRDLWPDHYLTLAPKAFRGLFRLALRPEFSRAARALRGAAGITAISEEFLRWGLRGAGRARGPADGVFPMGYPSPDARDDPEVRGRAAELSARFGFLPGEFLVAFVGSFSPSYDFEPVFGAARSLAGEGVRFVIAGGGEEEGTLRSQAGDLRNVTFTGWLDRFSVRALLSLSSAGLAPYRMGASMSLPNKPFEYMSAGLPILSTLDGELRALIESESVGVHYPPGDGAALTRALRQMIAAPADLGASRERSLGIFRSRFRYEAIYPRLVSHMENVAHG